MTKTIPEENLYYHCLRGQLSITCTNATEVDLLTSRPQQAMDIGGSGRPQLIGRTPLPVQGSTKEDIGIEQQLYEIVRGKKICIQLFELKVYKDDNTYKQSHSKQPNKVWLFGNFQLNSQTHKQPNKVWLL